MKIDPNKTRRTIQAAGLAFAVLIFGVSTTVAAKDALLGSPDFRPSPEQPVGWRGDGTGKFSGATPPMNWSLKDGKGTNIAWRTIMPFDSPSSVIAVGDKLFATGNNYELICADKLTGKILWVKPVSPYDAATKEEREANKEVFDKLDQQAQQRDALLAKITDPGTNGVFQLGGEISKIDGVMNGEVIKLLVAAGNLDKNYKSGIGGEGGFMAATPVSDGKFVFAWNGWGVTACFDLDGNRQWIRYDKLVPQEHGHYGSPLLVGDLVITYVGRQYLAFDKKTGKDAWRTDLKGGAWWFASHVSSVIGGEKVFAAGDGSLIRASDGVCFSKGALIHTGKGSPVFGGGFVFWMEGMGGVSTANNGSPVRYYQLPEKADAPFKPVIKGTALVPPDGGRHVVPSVLYHDGLLYVCGNNPIMPSKGKPALGPQMLLFVCDVLTEKVVYSKNLDFGNEPLRNDRPYGCGMAASPALAGGKIFLVGNFGTTLILEPGREYKEVGRNTIDQRINYYYGNNTLEGTVSTPFFDGNNIFYRAQRYLYCIGGPGK